MIDRRPKILIVDDQKANLVALNHLLGKVDADVVQAASGNEALKQTLEHDFALILLDINMPEMDGYEVAEFLGGEDNTAHIPIIFVTAAYKGDIYQMRGYGVGAVDYIEKPINETILLSKVEVFLELARNKELLQKAHDELEQRVEERTRSLHEEIVGRRLIESELRLAKVEADVANRTKTEFLSNMSHELRTPLNAIIGFSEMINLETLGPLGNKVYLEYINDIFHSGRHLLDIINDVLDVTAIEVGKMEVVFETVDVVGLADETLRAVQTRADKGSVSLHNDIDADTPKLNVDRRRTKQILLNLLSNAVKFTPEGGKIRVGAYANNDGGLILTVRDTGIGMNEDELEKSMEMFGQGDAWLSRKHEGTGLGLPLSKGLVEEHGGMLIVESAPGEGTVASVHFPPDRVIIET